MTTARVDIILRALGAGDVKAAALGVAGAFEDLGNSIKGVTLGALGGLSFTAFARNAIEAADRIEELSTRLGVSIEAVQVFGHLAKSTGQDADVFTSGIDRMGQSLREAVAGSESAFRRFQTLGIVLDEFKQLAPERQLEAIAQASFSASDQTAAFSAVAEILGTKNAPALRDALLQLAAGYDQVARSAYDSGNVMATETVRQLARAKGQWEWLGNKATILSGNVIHGVRTALGTPDEILFPRFEEGLARIKRNTDIADPIGFDSAAEIGALSDAADYHEIMAAAARARALAEQDAGQWLSVNQLKIDKIIATLREGQITDEARLISLQSQLAALQAQTEEQLEQAAGEKSRLRIQLESEEKRLRLVKEIGEVEKRLRSDQAAATKRILEANARIGGPEAEVLMIDPGRQPLGGAGAGEQTRDVDIYERTSIADATSDAVDDLARMGNIFDGIYRSILQTASGISQGLGSAIEGLILRTTTWGDALRNVGSAILNSIVSSFAQMVAQYAVSQVAMFALSKVFGAKRAATTAVEASAAAAAWSPAAVAASIATLGTAATTGTAAFITALALGASASTALAATGAITPLAEGGIAIAGRPYLMGEYGPELVVPRESSVVMNHKETSAIAAALGAGPGAGGQGARARDLVLVDSRREAERIRRGSQAEVDIIEIVRANKYRILI